MADPTTNAKVRGYFEDDDGPYTETLDPGNGSSTVPSEGTRLALVNPDGTNEVDLSNNERTGHVVTVVHNGGANTPVVSFADADFVGTGPANLDTEGDTATVRNTDGNSDGWVVVATGSA